MTKIVPSPDWFVGLSSVELCHNGGFKKSHVEEVCILISKDTLMKWTKKSKKKHTFVSHFPGVSTGRRHGQWIHIHIAKLGD